VEVAQQLPDQQIATCSCRTSASVNRLSC
jgi:hypothetical protein